MPFEANGRQYQRIVEATLDRRQGRRLGAVELHDQHYIQEAVLAMEATTTVAQRRRVENYSREWGSLKMRDSITAIASVALWLSC